MDSLTGRQQRRRRVGEEGGLAGVGEILEDVALLPTEGGTRRQQTLHKAAAVGAVGAEADLAPDDAVSQCLLGGVVGRFDSFNTRESPHGRFHLQQFAAGGGSGFVAARTSPEISVD